MSWLTLYTGGTGEIEEKKSRFIATIEPVSSEEEAAAFIAAIKKKYWDARHNCSAFVIGEAGEKTRCSDDGEPSGTAGRPMLDLLVREKITNVCVVVTRYFGGTLLGTGGLVRAYSAAVQEGLRNCTTVRRKPGFLIRVMCDYNDHDRIRKMAEKKGYHISAINYGEKVTLDMIADDPKALSEDVTDSTSGRAVTEGPKSMTYMVNEAGDIIE